MSAMTQARLSVLVLNAGSSSIKFAGYPADGGEGGAILRGQVAGIGAHPILSGQRADGTALKTDRGKIPGPGADHAAALAAIMVHLPGWEPGFRLVAAGHRVVHGGGEFTEPVRVTPAIVERLAALAPLAPHHQPHNIAAIRAMAAAEPDLPQVACFDTAFHAGQPAIARRLGLPRAHEDKGLRRYGFHGLSCEYVTGAFARVTGQSLPERTVIAHLGNGCSLTAVRGGHSVATSMGFSTVDGVPMATRSGAVDPGALLYLMNEHGLDHEGLRDLLYNRSGLLGVSGISADMKILLESSEPAAKEAVEFFCYRVVREIGSLAMALGGLDALVFTGGIGERAAPVRAEICRAAAWLGLDLDEVANARAASRIAKAGSRVSAWIVPTDEESVIARHALALIQKRETV
ncbi:MAG: acetate/propionate family kinase [Pseudomonadota bacterium]